MNSYLELTKQAVESYIKEGKIISPPPDLPEEFLTQKAGAFVTIMKDGSLRGCIGTYLPTKNNVAEEIIHNAIAVATEDYRFGPIQKEELPQLSYIVYVLSEPELVIELNPVEWASPKIRRILFNRVNPKKFGIIVKSGQKSGLLLPDLENINTAEKQISIACQKGGIDPVKEKIIIYKFTAEKYQ